MKIGIIGSGALGSCVARLIALDGNEVVIANRRGPDSMVGLLEEVGPALRWGAVEEAARADIVILAVRWVDLEGVVRHLPPWNGRIVVDATNPVAFLEPGSPEADEPGNPLAAYGIKAIDLGGRDSSDVVRGFVPGARLVKAFNHLDVRALAEPSVAGGRRVLFYSGDDAEAKAAVRSLIEGAGFWPVDLGMLAVGGPLAALPFGSLAGLNHVIL